MGNLGVLEPVLVLLVVAFVFVVPVWLFWRICTKASYPGPLALLVLVPPGVFAFGDWPAHRRAREEASRRPSPEPPAPLPRRSVNAPHALSRPQRVYVACTGVFLTALVLAEATAGKFFTAFGLPFPVTILGVEFTEVVMTAGVLAFPVTFIVTDVLNEYFGRAGIRFVTFLGVAMIALEFAVLQAALAVPTASISPISDASFRAVFGTTGRVIGGSVVAYLVGQLVDIALFHGLRRATGGRHLWLRATGSTFGSQLFDTLIVLTVAFAGQLGWASILAITLFNYAYKLLIAVAITPLVYAAHAGIDRYLGREQAAALVAEAANASGGVVVPEAG